MPYKTSPSKPFQSMERLLNSYKINAPALAGILGVSVPTARYRLTNPENFKFKDVALISKRAHIPMEELREAIKE